MLYLLIRTDLSEMKAARELIQECYGGKCRGLAYGIGLVCEIKVEIPEDLWETLSVVIWN